MAPWGRRLLRIIAGRDALAGFVRVAGPRAEVVGPTAESSANRSPLSGVVRLEAPKRLESRVDVVDRMVVRTLVEPAPADDAQPGAVGPAERRDRLGEQDRLADRRLELELVMVGQARDVRFVVGRQRPSADEIERRQVFLLEPDVDRMVDVAQTAAAFELERRPQVRVREDPAVGPEEPDPAGDRLGKPKVLTKIDRGIADLVDAIGARIVRQQSPRYSRPAARRRDRSPSPRPG